MVKAELRSRIFIYLVGIYLFGYEVHFMNIFVNPSPPAVTERRQINSLCRQTDRLQYSTACSILEGKRKRKWVG